MKTIHVLIAAALFAPLTVHAQSAGTTPPTDQTDTSVGSSNTGTTDTDIGTAGTGTTDTDVGSAGTGTNATDIGSAGTGTSGGDIGSSGTGTTGGNVGSSGTGTVTGAAGTYTPKLTLLAQSTSLRTPGSVAVNVVLSPDASLSPAQARDIVVPLSSSSSACTVPASVTVAWNSVDGGTASVEVACDKVRAQTVTISSGDASTSFGTK